MTQTSTFIQRTTHCQQCRRTKHRDAQRGRISEAVCRVTEGGLKRLHIAVFHFSDLQRKQSSKNRKQSSSCRGLEREWRFGLTALFCDLIAAVITQWYLSKVIKVCALKRVFYCVEIISQEKKNRKKKSLPPNCFPFPSLWRQSSLISLSGQDEQQAETCIEIVLCLETSLVWRPLLTHKNRKDAQMLFIGFDEAKAYLSRGETKLSFNPSWCISSCMGAGRGPKETEQSRGCPWDLEFLVCLFVFKLDIPEGRRVDKNYL